MILLRHGQSEFNIHFNTTGRDPGIADPSLTELGHAQAEHAARELRARGVSRIIASPYTRALQTAAPLAEALGLPVTVNTLVRERYAFSCDVGSPRTELAAGWPHLDFDHIEEVWWPPVEEPAAEVHARAELFRTEMSALPDWHSSVIVSHWGFILAMTGEALANGAWIDCDPTLPRPRRGRGR